MWPSGREWQSDNPSARLRPAPPLREDRTREILRAPGERHGREANPTRNQTLIVKMAQALGKDWATVGGGLRWPALVCHCTAPGVFEVERPSSSRRGGSAGRDTVAVPYDARVLYDTMVLGYNDITIL